MKFSKWSKFPIDGTWKEGSSDTYYTDINPYNGEVLTSIKLANKKDIDDAYETAKRVQKEWEATTPQNKVSVLEKAVVLIAERREELVELLIEEAGSTHLKANMEIDMAIVWIKEAATFSFQVHGEMLPSIVPGKRNLVYRSPVGVVSVITPWNYPFNLSLRSIAPALAIGNGVVVKPDLQTPITGGIFIAKIFEDAGLPRGLLNVIVADISEIGDAFIEHSIPKVICFTGSTMAGRHIGALAGEHFKKVTLELGGNNPLIVLDDADIDQAVSAATFANFMHQGQICMSTNRIIIDRKIYQRFMEKFKQKTMQLKVGNPQNRDTDIGPLINERQVEKIVSSIKKSIEQGANIILEGKISGTMMEPWILGDIKNEMSIANDEIFGPVAIIIPVDSEEEAIQVANDTPYGLTGSVFTGNMDKGVRVAQQMESGMFHVNDSSIHSEPVIPFGGEKSSGLGRHGGEWFIDQFTKVKWVSLQEQPRTYPFS